VSEGEHRGGLGETYIATRAKVFTRGAACSAQGSENITLESRVSVASVRSELPYCLGFSRNI
jgi:hypothetical protein